MNEKTKAAPLKGKPRAPRPGTNLKGKNFETRENLLPKQFAGCDLSRAKLPDEILEFSALDQVKEISADARKIFIGLLVACVYSWLVIGTTQDVDLLLNTASSPLPIINTPIPIAGFYVVGATLLAAVYCYFHFYLLRLWRTLAMLPAVFPDGVAVDDKTDPWLLTGLVRTYMRHVPARPLGYSENLLSIVLAWWLVPFTLFLYWRRFLPAHYIAFLPWLAFLIAFTTFFGQHTFRLARATLRREVPPAPIRRSGGQPQALLVGVWRELHVPRGQIFVWLFLPFFIILGFSIIAHHQSPRDSDTKSPVVFSLSEPWQSLREVDPTPAKLLNFVGIRTYADLREVDLAQRPEGWTGNEWDNVKRVDLRGRNLAFADLTRAFLANADLRETDLKGALLAGADLRGAVLERNNLSGADFSDARLEGANLELQDADLQGAMLARLWLRGANFSGAKLRSVSLWGAQLQGANLDSAQLQGADLRFAQLQNASLGSAQLQGAELQRAQLQGANLDNAQLQGANLQGAQLQGAVLMDAQLQGADLQRAQL